MAKNPYERFGVLGNDEATRALLLGRLWEDAKAFLTSNLGNENKLWSKNVVEHIEDMHTLLDSLPNGVQLEITHEAINEIGNKMIELAAQLDFEGGIGFSHRLSDTKDGLKLKFVPMYEDMRQLCREDMQETQTEKDLVNGTLGHAEVLLQPTKCKPVNFSPFDCVSGMERFQLPKALGGFEMYLLTDVQTNTRDKDDQRFKATAWVFMPEGTLGFTDEERRSEKSLFIGSFTDSSENGREKMIDRFCSGQMTSPEIVVKAALDTEKATAAAEIVKEEIQTVIDSIKQEASAQKKHGEIDK